MKYLKLPNGEYCPHLPDPQRWGSHLPTLCHYALRTTGPVIEFGGGIWSTPTLHSICENMGRRLVTVETNGGWREQLRQKWETPWHSILASPADPIIDVTRWSVVLIDQEPRELRQPTLIRMALRAEFIVCHDTGVEPWYGWDFSTMRWARQDRSLWGFTTVCSQTVDPNGIPYADAAEIP